MNFFEHQRVARKETWVLGVQFIFAIFGIIVISNILLFAAFKYLVLGTDGVGEDVDGLFILFNVAQLVLIFGGMAYKTISLMGGGKTIPRLMGGLEVDKSKRKEDHRVIVNIVDEISVASGIPSPPIYILEKELSINAFVSGFSSNDAVITITQGALRHLNREELQTVVAHEYSHLFNGDMRLNTYLIGILHGIQMIYITGQKIVEISTDRDGLLDRDRKPSVQLLVLGACFQVVGYLGVIFARMIKNEINEQREYLADATAVQYTRNSIGLVNTFKKIMANVNHQALAGSHGEMMGHMCITQYQQKDPGNKTHPDLEDRIKRIDKTFNEDQFMEFEFDGLVALIQEENRPKKQKKKVSDKSIRDELKIDTMENGLNLIVGAELLEQASKSSVDKQLLSSIGELNADSLGYSVKEIHKLPIEIRDVIHDKESSKAILCAVFIGLSGRDESKGIKKLGELSEKVSIVLPFVNKVERRFYLPLLDLCLGSLRELPNLEAKKFKGQLKTLIQDDSKIDLREFLYYAIISRFIQKKKSLGLNLKRISKLSSEIEFVLSLLAHAGFDNDSEGAQLALNRISKTHYKKKIMLLPLSELRIKQLNLNLAKLKELMTKDKEVFMNSCVDLINFDMRRVPLELELLRAIGTLVDAPLPQVIKKG